MGARFLSKAYFWNILISIDQLVNALFCGDPDETVSSRLGRKLRDGRKVPWWLRPLVWLLDRIDSNHCMDSIEEDK